MIYIKLLCAAIVLVGCVWMLMNQDQYIDKTHSLIDDKMSYEEWLEGLKKCATRQQVIDWYLDRPFDSHKVKYAFYDKMQELEDINKVPREVFSFN